VNCESADALLSDLIDGELSRDDRVAVEAHVASCERCARALHQLKRTVRFVRTNAGPELAPGTPGGTYMEMTRAMSDTSLRGDAERVLRDAGAAKPAAEGDAR